MTRLRCALFFLVVCLGLSSTAADASETCAPESGNAYEVVRVLDSETLLLDSGREVRLIGALAPKPDTLLTAAEDWPPAREAAQALEALVLHRTVSLRYDGRRRDRYGRELAQLYVAGPNGTEWVQRALVSAGHARAYALAGNTSCLKELVAAEADARVARRGIWSRESFRVREAADPKALLQLTGRFVLVEGRVTSVARVQKTTYLNFGTDWRSDFTASIANTIADRGKGGAVQLSALAGQEIRVRGWIERRNGPMIVLTSLDEIEVIGPRAEVPSVSNSSSQPDTKTPR
ncbi:thermonuclease family protein [Hyphomicrobium sp. LHD-15]|uniref:thermonuclease family protein n=1 Tax=Hyphomicrobium sp. LHD-15 TaxID=3072142 RepID=UPI00280E15C7|nr:thermonuclease family protein [Hyphomicrobium sp. LHD-15]MDQ8698541.1 thermonuclease family protein [Hyphomicrobium sp. LHD-15]